MTKIISSSLLSKELQKRIKLEVSSLKQSKRVISKTELSEEAKAFLNKVVKGKWIQREDGKIDVSGDVNAQYEKDLHLFMGKEIFFEEVSGDFYCFGTKISSLKGAPKKVGGDFHCYYTNITSLEGAPREVGDSFFCSDTKISSLKGAPKKVGGDFYCERTNITSLEGIGEVKGKIYSKILRTLTKNITISTAELPQFILREATALQKFNNEEALTESQLAIEGTREDVKVTLTKNNKIRQGEHVQALKNQANKLVALLKKEGIKEINLEHVETLDMFRVLEGSREESDIIEQFARVATDVYAIVNLPINVATEINEELLGIMQGREDDSFDEDDISDIFGDLGERAKQGRALLLISAHKAELLVEILEDEDEDDED